MVLWHVHLLRVLLTAVLSVTLASALGPYSVLVLGPVGTHSLYYLTKSLSEALGDAGHSVTLLSTFGPSSSHPMVTEVTTGASVDYLEDYNFFDMRHPLSMKGWHMEATKIMPVMWTNADVKRLWERRRKFDAIVIISYANEVAVPFLLDYEGAFISFCTPGTELFSVSHLGHWLPMSIVPSIVLPFDEHMSLLERLVIPLMSGIIYVVYYWHSLPLIQKIVEEYFPQMPPIQDLYENSHVMLINVHFALDELIPLLPTQVEVGTICAKPPKPLQQDLEEFVNGSGEAGVIYFSLGSVIKAKDIPQHLKLYPLHELSELRIYLDNIILLPDWKISTCMICHSKTRRFISHCGNIGTQEAKYHGIPVLAVPVAFDQPRNAARMARKGFGLVLDWEDMTTEAIVDAAQTILNDTSYAFRLKQVSEALRDQKETPAERAVWWIEYAIRSNACNSSYLEYAGKKLHFLQYIQEDAIAFWVAVLVILYSVCARLCRYCGKGRKEAESRTEKVS
ncbi:UDP-glucosyltransferase 2-like [Macrobrachium nipponense]|uniref:UDP-glucosyltransferase 2-like n=1 Tax=Macrobrachium nipponense TaxID=159736 RepID=UPI0030C88D23